MTTSDFIRIRWPARHPRASWIFVGTRRAVAICMLGISENVSPALANQLYPVNPIELAPEVAKAFVRAMHAFDRLNLKPGVAAAGPLGPLRARGAAPLASRMEPCPSAGIDGRNGEPHRCFWAISST
jgi:hypothetical protein